MQCPQGFSNLDVNIEDILHATSRKPVKNLRWYAQDGRQRRVRSPLVRLVIRYALFCFEIREIADTGIGTGEYVRLSSKDHTIRSEWKREVSKQGIVTKDMC